MTEGRDYDPTIYPGSAAHYARGRPAYSTELASTLASEVLLDGRGRLLDVGCGPGTLINQLAGFFEVAVGLEPDADMLAEASRSPVRPASAMCCGWKREPKTSRCSIWVSFAS